MIIGLPLNAGESTPSMEMRLLPTEDGELIGVLLSKVILHLLYGEMI